METRRISIAPGYEIGGGARPLFFAGPCVIESRQHSLAMASRLRKIGEETGARIVFKSSYDKANRSSRESFRGPGLQQGLDILADVRPRRASRSSPTSTRRNRRSTPPIAMSWYRR